MTARLSLKLAARPGDEERWRVFLAIDLPDPVRAALQGPVDDLRPLGDLVRVNALDRVHLTLHFLGHQPVELIQRLQPRLAQAVAGQQGLALAARGVGAFPGLGRAQVLWAGIVGEALPRLVSLQRELGETLGQAGIALEARERFRPHLTLARVRRPIRGAQRKLLTEWHARWKDAPFGELPVLEINLMRSQLGAGPPRYSRIAAFGLK